MCYQTLFRCFPDCIVSYFYGSIAIKSISFYRVVLLVAACVAGRGYCTCNRGGRARLPWQHVVTERGTLLAIRIMCPVIPTGDQSSLLTTTLTALIDPTTGPTGQSPLTIGRKQGKRNKQG